MSSDRQIQSEIATFVDLRVWEITAGIAQTLTASP